MAFLRSIRSQNMSSVAQKLLSRSDYFNVNRISCLPEIQRRSISFHSLFGSKNSSDSDQVEDAAEEQKNKKSLEEIHHARCELTDMKEEVSVLQDNREIEMQDVSKMDGDDSGKHSKVNSLHKAFRSVPSKSSKSSVGKDPIARKTLSPEMAMLVTHLYEEGYFKDANFVNKEKIDITCFKDNYSWNYIKHAVIKFAKDRQEVAKLLPAEDLKKVALYGCPSLEKKGVYSAKCLRQFFKIQEDTVCGKCGLREMCKFESEGVGSHVKVTEIRLHTVMRVITLYALGPLPQQLVLTPEVMESVNRLLREVVNHSKASSAKPHSESGIPTTSN